MISSHSVPGPESPQPAAGEPLGQMPVAQFVNNTRQTGVALLVVGAVGGIAGLLFLSPLGILLALVSGVAGAYLVRACQQLGPSPGWREGGAEHATDAPGDHGVVILKQGVALAGDVMAALRQAGVEVVEVIAGFVRGVLKVLACMIAGLGVGLITVGIFALRQPELWEYEVLARVGPPLAPVALGAGIGLVVAEVLMLALFYRPWSRRAKPTGVASARGTPEG